MAMPLGGFFFHDFKNSYIPFILKDIYLDRIYDPYLIGKSNPCIVDAGANIGLTSYYFKDFAEAVFAVEPARIHLEAMTEMIAFNNIKNIRVVPYALSPINMVTYLYHHTNTTMYGLNPNLAFDPSDKEIVMGIDMKTLMNDCKIGQIDFLKLDIEGMESDVIKSAAFKEMSPKIRVIVGETHAWNNMSKEDFKKELESQGYAFRYITEAPVTIFEAIRK